MQWVGTGTKPVVTLFYSLNGGSYYSFTPDETTISLQNVGDSVTFKSGDTPNYRFSSGANYYYKFVMTGKIAASGNIGSIINASIAGNISELSNYALGSMFLDCSALIEPPILNIDVPKNGCFFSMFLYAEMP